MQKIAESRGGKCLSSEYVTNTTKLKLKCKTGHEWIASPKQVKKGSWCPVCAKNK